MRGLVRGLAAVLLLGAGAAMTLPSPAALSADLGVTTERRAVHRARVVRDYDGTPVVMRRDEMIAAPRATPTRWLNGQPVLPQSRPIRVY